MILETISDLRLTPGTVANRYAKVLGYHTPGDEGGGDFYWDSSSTETDNGGTVFESPGHPGRWTRGITSELNVHWFGAKGDEVADDTAAIQATFNCAKQFANVDGGYPGSGTNTHIIFYPKIYCIKSEISVHTAYFNIFFNNAVFIPHSSIGGVGTTVDFYCFNFDYAWCAKMSNLNIRGFRRAFRLFNPNSNTGFIEIDGLNISKCGYVEINVRSSELTVKNLRIIDTDHIYIKQCDKLHISEGWINAPTFTKKYSGLFTIDHASIVTFEKLIFTPTDQVLEHNKLFYIKNNWGLLKIKDCQFGGEPGQICLVGMMSQALGGRGVSLEMSNTQAFCNSSAWVKLFRIPDRIYIENPTGLADVTHIEGIVTYATEDEVVEHNTLWPVQSLPDPPYPDQEPNPTQPLAKSFDDSYADLVGLDDESRGVISIIGPGVFSFGDLFTYKDRKLFRLLVGINGERFGHEDLPNEGFAVLKFSSIKDSTNSWQCKRGRTFKITLSTVSYPGPGRYAEWIVEFNYDRSFNFWPLHAAGDAVIGPYIQRHPIDNNQLIAGIGSSGYRAGLLKWKIENIAANQDPYEA